MISKKLFYKSFLLLSSVAVATTFISSFAIKQENNNIVKNQINSFKSSNISGEITTIDTHYDHVEVNLSGYDIDLGKYNVNVDQTSETGIPLNNDFQIHFEIVSKNKFKIYRTSVRKYYRLYILEKNSSNPKNDKKYFTRVIKVENFSGIGSNVPNKKVISSIEISNFNDSNWINIFKSFFVDKGFFKKESGFDRKLLDDMVKWDMGKVYDEMNGKLFNVSSKSTFINEVLQIGYDLEYKKEKEIETLNFWIILKEQYIFKINNSSDFLTTADFQIERLLPPTTTPPIQDDVQNHQNANASSTQSTIFIASSVSILLFIIAIILFIVINNKNKNKLKRNHDLENAIKKRNK